MSLTVEERFEAKVERLPIGGCLVWTGGLAPTGYGQFRIDKKGRSIGAHRASYLLHKGDIPNNKMVLHRCDNKSCVNPEHLYLGDAKQNAIDAVERGRYLTGSRWDTAHIEGLQRGEKHHSARLNELAVRDIRNSHESCAKLARKYGVSNVTINRIKRRIIWSHVQ